MCLRVDKLGKDWTTNNHGIVSKKGAIGVELNKELVNPFFVAMGSIVDIPVALPGKPTLEIRRLYSVGMYRLAFQNWHVIFYLHLSVYQLSLIKYSRVFPHLSGEGC